ncbi:MAG: hypothetical protein NT167_28665 [Verrucomicrobia bacterium]|nr:hypothetical protein [Verrucomicrobiota bacterium]
MSAPTEHPNANEQAGRSFAPATSLGVPCRYCGRPLRQVNIAKRGYCLKCCRIHRQVPLGRVVRRHRMDNDITPEDFARNVRQWALDARWSDHQFRVGVQIALKRLKTPNAPAQRPPAKDV